LPFKTGYTNTFFCSYDLNIDPIIFIYEPDLYILKMYSQTEKNEVSRSRLSKVRALQRLKHRQTDRQTDRQIDREMRLKAFADSNKQ